MHFEEYNAVDMNGGQSECWWRLGNRLELLGSLSAEGLVVRSEIVSRPSLQRRSVFYQRCGRVYGLVLVACHRPLPSRIHTAWLSATPIPCSNNVLDDSSNAV